MGEKRRAVHEDRADAWDALTEAVEDGEAVCVDVAPVHDLPFCEPRDKFERRDGEALAEHHDGVRHLWEGEVAGLVLDDEDGGYWERKLCQLIGPQLQLGELFREARNGREEPEADISRAWPEAVPGGEVVCRRVDPADWQNFVEQTTEDLAVALYELRVDVRDVEVPKVEGKRIVLGDPARGRDEVRPVVETGDRVNGMGFDPRGSIRQLLPRGGQQRVEAFKVGADSDELRQLLD